MSENQPRYYSIFYKNGLPKPKEPLKERKRKMKTSNNAEKQVKIEVVREVSEVNELREITPMETEEIPCNWDNLPNELKMMCIERTDFKTRANLMLSNRHNKMLVESIKSKYPLSFVRFSAYSSTYALTLSFHFAVKSWRSEDDYKSFKYEPRKFMDVLLNAKIDKLELYIEPIDVIDRKFLSDLKRCNRKFSVKTLQIRSGSFGALILEHCDEHLEHLSVNMKRNTVRDVGDFLKMPRVTATKRVTIYDEQYDDYDSDDSDEDVEIEDTIGSLIASLNDQNIGKEIVFHKTYESLLWEIFSKIAENSTDFRHPTEEMIRLRLQNPEKQAWVWYSEDDVSLNFLVVASGSDAPNVKEIQKQRAKEEDEYDEF